MSRWEGIEEFIAIVDNESFSAAAKALGVSKAHVSQQLSRLEERLGSRLLNRTTRKMSLTETGTVYIEKCRHILEELHNAEYELLGTQNKISGRLRISSPHLIGEFLLIPALTDFQSIYSDLDIEIDLTSRRVNLLESNYDIALQMSARKDVNVVNHPLFKTRFRIVASPDYIKKNGIPNHPDELKEFNCLLFSSEGITKPWKFQTTEKGTYTVNVKSRWKSNNGHLLLAAARSGLGIAYLPDYYLKDDIQSGNLCEILHEWQSIDRHVVAIYQERRFLPAKIKTFLTHLDRHIESYPRHKTF